MSFGGGYQRTNYGAGGGDDAGGFMAGSQQGSQGGGSGGGTKSYGDESLRPVTIKQLADYVEPYPQAEPSIDGAPITQLTLVGQIRKINQQTTNIAYTIDDGTATIEVKRWIDADQAAAGDGESTQKFSEDQHVRVWGRLKVFNGKKHVGAHFMRAIDDYNEVNYHMVEAAYVHLYITKGPPAAADGQNPGQGQKTGGAGDGGDSMFVDNDGYAGADGGGEGGETPQQKLARAGPLARRMYQYLNKTPGGNEGLHLNMVSSATGMSMRDAAQAADELNQLGLVYSTVDEETFAILEF